MCFTRGEGNGVACFQIARMAVDLHACNALKHDKQFVHVGVRVGGEDFARGDDDACDLGERGQVIFAEPDLLLRRGIVTDRLFRRAIDAAEMHTGGQDERLRDHETKRPKDREISRLPSGANRNEVEISGGSQG